MARLAEDISNEDLEILFQLVDTFCEWHELLKHRESKDSQVPPCP
jgi:hypothetical protein